MIVQNTDPSGDPAIVRYLHCKVCVDTMPAHVSMAEWAYELVGIDADCHLIVWCARHQLRVGRFALDTTQVDARLFVCAHCQAGEPHEHG